MNKQSILDKIAKLKKEIQTLEGELKPGFQSGQVWEHKDANKRTVRYLLCYNCKNLRAYQLSGGDDPGCLWSHDYVLDDAFTYVGMFDEVYRVR